MLVLKPIFIAFSDVFFGIIIIVGYILTALSSIMCSVPLSTPEMSKSSSGNLIADVIEKARPGIPVRLYTDNKVGLSFTLETSSIMVRYKQVVFLEPP
jgi:hypothetical protein